MTRTIELKVWLTYEPDEMYDNDDPESFDWFLKNTLYGDNLRLVDFEYDFPLGDIEVIEVDMMDVHIRKSIDEHRQKREYWESKV